MVETPGYCSRRLTCRIAASGQPVMVALGAPFVCPECGDALVAPALDDVKPVWRRPALLAPAVAMALILAGGAMLAKAGFFGGRVAPPAPAVAFLAPALLPQTPPVVVAENPTAPPAVSMAADDISAPARVSSARAPRRGDAPAGVARKTLAGRRRAEVHLAVSIPLVAGGVPDYPEQYDDGRSGSVTVDCALAPNGVPDACRTTRLSGGRIFDVAVHSWLELKDVRFRTTRGRGQPRMHGVTLTVHFIGDTPPP